MEPTNTNIPQMQPTQNAGNKKVLITIALCAVLLIVFVMYLGGAFTKKEIISDEQKLTNSLTPPETTEVFGDTPQEKAVLDSLTPPKTGGDTVSEDVMKSLQAN